MGGELEYDRYRKMEKKKKRRRSFAAEHRRSAARIVHVRHQFGATAATLSRARVSPM